MYPVIYYQTLTNMPPSLPNPQGSHTMGTTGNYWPYTPSQLYPPSLPNPLIDWPYTPSHLCPLQPPQTYDWLAIQTAEDTTLDWRLFNHLDLHTPYVILIDTDGNDSGYWSSLIFDNLYAHNVWWAIVPSKLELEAILYVFFQHWPSDR